MTQEIKAEKTIEAQPVETEEVLGAKENESEVLPPKFKNVTALLNAYNSLQSEFTKRCQKIKELEGILNAEKVSSPADKIGEQIQDGQGITEEGKIEILKGYLKEVASNGQKVIFIDNDGVGVKARTEKPKSIREAGILAKEIL